MPAGRHRRHRPLAALPGTSAQPSPFHVPLLARPSYQALPNALALVTDYAPIGEPQLTTTALAGGSLGACTGRAPHRRSGRSRREGKPESKAPSSIPILA